MSHFPEPFELTAHQPPALVVATLESASEDGSQALTTLCPELTDLYQLCEACAQSVAVLMGHHARQQAQSSSMARAEGMLVGLKGAVLVRQPAAHETLQVSLNRLLEMPPFAVYAARISDGEGRTVMEAEIKTMTTNEAATGDQGGAI